MSSIDDLPPALPAMWRALKRGYEAEPLLLSVAFLLSLLAALPDALLALWLKFLADGMLGGRRGLVLIASVGLGVSAAATWFLREEITDRIDFFTGSSTVSQVGLEVAGDNLSYPDGALVREMQEVVEQP